MPGRCIAEDGLGRLEDALEAGEALVRDRLELGAVEIHRRPVHRSQDAVGDVGRPGVHKEVPAARIRHLGLPLPRYISRGITVKIRGGGAETTTATTARRPVAAPRRSNKAFAQKEGRARSPASLLLRFFRSKA